MDKRTSIQFFKMDNTIQNYDWGSQTAFSSFFGFDNTNDLPQAELWMGVHPNGESYLCTGEKKQRLSDFINLDQKAILGSETLTLFNSFPFLFKVLAAEKALSIQVHPCKERAEEGFHRDNVMNVFPEQRNYKDSNHKPELVYALTPYLAMNGFRDHIEIYSYFISLNSEILNNLLLGFEGFNADALETFFYNVMTLSETEKLTVLDDLLTFSVYQTDPMFSLVQELSLQYPNDIGLFAPLFLNVVELSPGQSMFLDAGVPHAYIRGVGLEIMANSDNVLRAGLTNKHIDVNELVKNTKFDSILLDDVIFIPTIGDGVIHYNPSADEFKLSVYHDVKRRSVEVKGPEILFAIDDDVHLLSKDGQEIFFSKGESVFVPFYTESYLVTTVGKVARAYVF